MQKYSPVLKYPGAKWRIASKIVALLPQHHSYLEPYFGSGAVLFNKQPSAIETVNDLDDRVYQLFKMVREQPEFLARMVADTPYCRVEYDKTFSEHSTTPNEIVRQFLVQCWMGYGYRTNDYKQGWKNDVQGRESAYALRSWNRLPVWIVDAAKRLKQVQITNEPALELIKRFNHPNVLIYADPPYVLSTRNGGQYRHEMSDEDHWALLQALLEHKGPVMLSGYRSQMYEQVLKDWHDLDIRSHAEHGSFRIETLWTNFNPIRQLSITDWE